MSQSEKFKAFIKTFPCLICGSQSVPHHLQKNANMSQKPSDFETVPLCSNHHAELHTLGEKQFEGKYNIDLWSWNKRLRGYYEKRN